VDLFIDDRNIGGLPGWGEIWHMLNPGENLTAKEQLKRLNKNNKTVMNRIIKLLS